MTRGDKRIVHLTTVHDARDPRIVRKELRTLDKAGYDAHLMAPAAPSQVADGVSGTPLPDVEGRLRRLLAQRSVYRRAKALAADCYHFHDPELIPLGFLLKRATGARMIYDMHEDYRWHGPIQGRCIRALERWCFRWVDHVVVANAAHIEITDASDVPTTRIANYYKPAPDVQEPSCVPDPEPRTLPAEGPIRPIYTGVMSDRRGRGLSMLVNLAHRAKQSDLDLRLQLVGVCYVNRIRRRVNRRIRRDGLDAVVHRVGWEAYVPWPRLARHYTDAHVGLVLGTDHPNQTQKIPTKFYEYLQFGLPILCSDFPEWRRFVEAHDCGRVVPPGDVQAALEVLREWRAHPKQYRARSAAALRAAPRYRWKSEGRRLVKLYDRLLSKHQGAPTE